MPTPARLGLPLIALAAAWLAGCATQTYAPRPVDLAAEPAQRLALRADDAALREALARQGIDVSIWPLPVWDEPALVALALARQPEMAVARAELRAAQAGTAASGASTTFGGVETTLEHHGGPAVSPWTLGLVVDALFTGDARRRAQAEAADALADEALQRAAEAVWSARQRVRTSLRDLALATEQRDASDAVLAQQRAVVAALRSRLALGAIDSRELALAAQAEAETQRQALRAGEAMAASNGALAAALGLAPEALQTMRLAVARPAENEAISATPIDLQRTALVNRLDLRAALARHAQAEAALKLEVARQWPELVFKPGIAWDQGETRWSFGLALSLPPGGDNRTAIERARAERELSAERVRALQAQALVRLDAARLALAAADQQQASALDAARQARDSLARAERSFDAGNADRLDLATARRAEAEARRLQADARASRQAAVAALEDALQRPLDMAALGSQNPTAQGGIALAADRPAHP